MLTSLAVVALFGLAPCSNPGPLLGPTDDTLRALYEAGVPFSTFLESAKRRKDQWDAHYGDGRVTDEQVARAEAVGRGWRILAIAEDWCGDSANTIPYLARLVERVAGLDMRVINSTAGKLVMEAHRTPDGRAATPTVILLDAEWNEAGCFVERPSPLMSWYMDNHVARTTEELHEYILSWYAEDAGAHTVDDILTLLESAAAGDPRCGSGAG